MKIIIATLQLCFLCSCQSTQKPKTHTPVPSLNSSIEMTTRLQRHVSDAKSGIRRARTLQERIDNKASLLE